MDKDDNIELIPLGITATPLTIEVIKEVFGELSDGIWEDSEKLAPWWMFYRGIQVLENGKMALRVVKAPCLENLSRPGHCKLNPYRFGSDTTDAAKTRKKLASFIYQIVRKEGCGWSQPAGVELNYLSATIGEVHSICKCLTSGLT